MLSGEQIEKFIELWRNRFHEEISREEAITSGIALINLVKLVYNPITIEQFKEVKDRIKELKNEE